MLRSQTHTHTHTHTQTHTHTHTDREWIGKGRVGHREPELKEWIEAAMEDVPEV